MTERPKRPVACEGLYVRWTKNGRDVEADEADLASLRYDCEEVEFAWPARAAQVRAVSKMIRSALSAGGRAKANEILDALGVSEEART